MALSREDALALLQQHVQSEKMLAHSYASEAVMTALARRLGRDEQKWGLAGLLHDLDIEMVGGDLAVHGLPAATLLREQGIDDDIVDAIRMHNETATGQERSLEFQHALAAGETITGLITATAMVYPDKRIAGVKPKSVIKRIKEKTFAASVRRENIRECEKIGIPLDEFVALALDAMKGIHEQLGL
jgi:putative nucleotidyltransferase with HDIG domain